ncbi:MAG: hypothetical protein F9K31_14165, partial [Dokdonella sp.]
AWRCRRVGRCGAGRAQLRAHARRCAVGRLHRAGQGRAAAAFAPWAGRRGRLARIMRGHRVQPNPPHAV